MLHALRILEFSTGTIVKRRGIFKNRKSSYFRTFILGKIHRALAPKSDTYEVSAARFYGRFDQGSWAEIIKVFSINLHRECVRGRKRREAILYSFNINADGEIYIVRLRATYCLAKLGKRNISPSASEFLKDHLVQILRSTDNPRE